MQLELSELNDAIVAKVSDDLDLLGYQKLVEEVDALLQSGKKKIIIDLSAASYVNVTTANALVTLTEKVKKADGALALAKAQSGPLIVMKHAGAAGSLSLHETVDEAAAAVGASG